MLSDGDMVRLDVYFVELYAVGIEIAEHISVFSLISEIGAQMGAASCVGCALRNFRTFRSLAGRVGIHDPTGYCLRIFSHV